MLNRGLDYEAIHIQPHTLIQALLRSTGSPTLLMPLLSFWAKVVGSTVVFASILSVQSSGVLAWGVCLML